MYAMDSWLETLEDEVGPYVEPLLRIVFMALDSPDARPQVREMLLSATASAAAAAGDAMHPHLSALLPRLERCLVATGDADLKPRARALEVLGMLVSARGRPRRRWRPTFPPRWRRRRRGSNSTIPNSASTDTPCSPRWRRRWGRISRRIWPRA